MAIAVYVHPKSMTSAQYDEVIRQLDAAGVGQPSGRLHHSCFGPPDALMVYDIWTSEQDFEAFGQTLLPILGTLGVEMGAPDIMPLYNVIG